MIKKTLYFGSPAYLSCKNEQLVIDFKKEQLGLEFFVEVEDNRYESRKDLNKSIPVADIGVIILDHYGITLSQYLLNALLENNTAVITCGKTHHPSGLFLNLDSHTLQQEKFRSQIECMLPLKKQFWQQTIQQKIKNQAELLIRKGIEAGNMLNWVKDVKSGDAENHEARAAAYYWKAIFHENIDFYRARNGPSPNSLLNYGYAILRALTARALSASGLLPTLGIHHHNKYNAYALADDIMEPYRPFIDAIVYEITTGGTEPEELTPVVKKKLFEITSADVCMDNQKSPLMIAVHRTASSLAKCYERTLTKILYPEFI
jgi:CRISPR-associated protein Cas1